MGKTKFIFFSETMRPRASIFCRKQCLVVPIINCANHGPGAKFGNAAFSGGFRGGSRGSLEPPSGAKIFHFHGEFQ